MSACDRRARGGAGLVALALAAGCGPSEREIWGAVLLFAWLPYLFGLLALRLLFTSWSQALPELRFGRLAHALVFAGLVSLAVWAGPEADPELVALVFWLYGATLVTLWLIVWRLGHCWPRSQAFVWSGAVAAALSVAPAIAGLASPALQEFGGLGIPLWCWGGLGGLGPMVLLIIFLVEASYAAGYARTAAEAAGS